MTGRLPLLFLLLLPLAPGGRALAWCQMTTSSAAPAPGSPCRMDGIPLHWERRCMTYAVDVRVTPEIPLEDVRRVVAQAFGKWTAVTCGEAPVEIQVQDLGEVAACQEIEFHLDGPNVNTVAFIDDWEERELPSNAFALTTVWHSRSSGRILDVDMLINRQLGPYEICPDSGCVTSESAVDLENVVTHEAGHFLGIGHSNIADATMAATSLPGELAKRSLEADDIEAMCAIYPPGSLPAECDFAPAGGSDPGCVDRTLTPRLGGCAATGRTGDGTLAWLLSLLLLLAVRARGASGC